MYEINVFQETSLLLYLLNALAITAVIFLGVIYGWLKRIAMQLGYKEIIKPTTSTVQTLQQLSTDENVMVRKNVAKNPNTPPEILQQLSTDADPIVRIDVAANPNTSLEVLQQLSTDKNEYVRSNVDKNSQFTTAAHLPLDDN